MRANKAAESRTDYWRSFSFGKSLVLEADCLNWLREGQPNTIHAVVADPPYGLFEYSSEQQEKLRNCKGGVWRIPPSFDGVQRAPLPRFTILSQQDLRALELFFLEWAQLPHTSFGTGSERRCSFEPAPFLRGFRRTG
jgi:site-specific DNA-methyltransferase (adenine-specific)